MKTKNAAKNLSPVRASNLKEGLVVTSGADLDDVGVTAASAPALASASFGEISVGCSAVDNFLNFN